MTIEPALPSESGIFIANFGEMTKMFANMTNASIISSGLFGSTIMQKIEEREPMLARLGTILVSEDGVLEAGSWNVEDRQAFNGYIIELTGSLDDVYKAIKRRLLDLGFSDTHYHKVYNELLGRNQR